MKLSKAEMRILVKHFKGLVEQDVLGITATDARNTVQNWLEEVGQVEASNDFSQAVYKYQTSSKIAKQQEEYDSY